MMTYLRQGTLFCVYSNMVSDILKQPFSLLHICTHCTVIDMKTFSVNNCFSSEGRTNWWHSQPQGTLFCVYSDKVKDILKQPFPLLQICTVIDMNWSLAWPTFLKQVFLEFFWMDLQSDIGRPTLHPSPWKRLFMAQLTTDSLNS